MESNDTTAPESKPTALAEQKEEAKELGEKTDTEGNGKDENAAQKETKQDMHSENQSTGTTRPVSNPEEVSKDDKTELEENEETVKHKTTTSNLQEDETSVETKPAEANELEQDKELVKDETRTSSLREDKTSVETKPAKENLENIENRDTHGEELAADMTVVIEVDGIKAEEGDSDMTVVIDVDGIVDEETKNVEGIESAESHKEGEEKVKHVDTKGIELREDAIKSPEDKLNESSDAQMSEASDAVAVAMVAREVESSGVKNTSEESSTALEICKMDSETDDSVDLNVSASPVEGGVVEGGVVKGGVVEGGVVEGGVVDKVLPIGVVGVNKEEQESENKKEGVSVPSVVNENIEVKVFKDGEKLDNDEKEGVSQVNDDRTVPSGNQDIAQEADKPKVPENIADIPSTSDAANPPEHDGKGKTSTIWYTDDADQQQDDASTDTTSYSTSIVGGVVVRTPMSSSPKLDKKSPKQKEPSPSKFKMAWGSLFKRKKSPKKSAEKDSKHSSEGKEQVDAIGDAKGVTSLPESSASSEAAGETDIKQEAVVNVEAQVKVETEAKPNIEVQSETDVKIEAEPTVEVKSEMEVSPEEEVKEDVVKIEEKQEETEVKSKVVVSPEVEVKEDVVKIEEKQKETEVKSEPEVDIIPDAEAIVETTPEEVTPETEVKVETDATVEAEIKVESEGEIQSEKALVGGKKVAVEGGEGAAATPAMETETQKEPEIEEDPSKHSEIAVISAAGVSSDVETVAVTNPSPVIDVTDDTADDVDLHVDGVLPVVSEESSADQSGEKDVTSDPETAPDEDSVLRERIANRQGGARSVSPNKTKQMQMRFSYAESSKDGQKEVEVIGTREVTLRPKTDSTGHPDHRVSCRELGDADYEGWLTKRGGGALFSSWKRKWVVLKELRLYYYKTSFDPVAGGVINLEEYQVSAAPEMKRRFCFKCESKTTKGHEKYFAADTEEDMTKWLEVLAKASKGEVAVTQTHLHVQMRKKTNSMSHFARRAGSVLGIGGAYDYDGTIEKHTGPRRRASFGSSPQESTSPPIEKRKEDQETDQESIPTQRHLVQSEPKTKEDENINLHEVVANLRGESESLGDEESKKTEEENKVSAEDEEKDKETGGTTEGGTCTPEVAPVGEVAEALEEIQIREEGETPQIVPLSEAAASSEDTKDEAVIKPSAEVQIETSPAQDEAETPVIKPSAEVQVETSPVEADLDSPQIVPLSEAVVVPIVEAEVESKAEEGAVKIKEGGEYVTLEIGATPMDVTLAKEEEKAEEKTEEKTSETTTDSVAVEEQSSHDEDVAKEGVDQEKAITQMTTETVTITTEVQKVESQPDQGPTEGENEAAVEVVNKELPVGEEAKEELAAPTVSQETKDEHTEHQDKGEDETKEDKVADAMPQDQSDGTAPSASPGMTKWYVTLDSEQNNWTCPEAEVNASPEPEVKSSPEAKVQASPEAEVQDTKRQVSNEDEMLSMVRNIKDAHLTFVGTPLPGNEERVRAMTLVSKENAEMARLKTLERSLQDKQHDVEALDELLNKDHINHESVEDWKTRHSQLSDELVPEADGRDAAVNGDTSDAGPAETTEAVANGEHETPVDTAVGEQKLDERLEVKGTLTEKVEKPISDSMNEKEDQTVNGVQTVAGGDLEGDSLDTHF